MNTEAVDIPIEQIKVMVHRARDKGGWEQLKQSLATVGLNIPVQVRMLARKSPDGHKYELICGEGRLTAAKALKWETIPALIIDAEEAEIAGRFLAENMIRKAIPWGEKAKLIKSIVDAGTDTKQACRDLSISLGYGYRLLGLEAGLSPEVKAEAKKLQLEEAEALATVPSEGQKIVLEVAASTGETVASVVKAGRKVVVETEGWTKAALEKALRSTDDDLRKLRERTKSVRLHAALGPENLRAILKDNKIRKALEAAKITIPNEYL